MMQQPSRWRATCPAGFRFHFQQGFSTIPVSCCWVHLGLGEAGGCLAAGRALEGSAPTPRAAALLRCLLLLLGRVPHREQLAGSAEGHHSIHKGLHAGGPARGGKGVVLTCSALVLMLSWHQLHQSGSSLRGS